MKGKMRKTGKMCGKCVIVMIINAWRHVLLWLLRFAGTKLNTRVEGSRSQRRLKETGAGCL